MAIDWETCDAEGCIGARVASSRLCVAHAEDWDLKAVARSPDLRGVTLDHGLLRSIIGHAPSVSGRRVLNGARFAHAMFPEDADFREVTFAGDASFERATFAGPARFTRSAFDAVTFRDAVFRSTAELTHLELRDGADLSRTLFEDTVRLSCRLTGTLTFDEARFAALSDLTIAGPDAEAIHFDNVLCEGQIDARMEASRITVFRSRLERGGQLSVLRGTLAVEARLGRPMLLRAVPYGWASDPPRLLYLSGSDLSGTTISGFDMTDTRFARAHGLDGLRIDGRLLLRREHRPFRARRLVLADETDAREGSTASYEEVAAIYRELRAGQEGRKDEPGSADFYYGEMEMRRRAAKPLSVERAILETYRVIAGYGLRAWRALATLAALVLAATVLFHEGLVEDPPRWLATLLFSLRSTVSFVREPQLEGLTLAGEYVQLGLRFAGPALLVLAILAIRARVRR